MSDFKAKMYKFDFGGGMPQTALGKLTLLPQNL